MACLTHTHMQRDSVWGGVSSRDSRGGGLGMGLLLLRFKQNNMQNVKKLNEQSEERRLLSLPAREWSCCPAAARLKIREFLVAKKSERVAHATRKWVWAKGEGEVGVERSLVMLHAFLCLICWRLAKGQRESYVHLADKHTGRKEQKREGSKRERVRATTDRGREKEWKIWRGSAGVWESADFDKTLKINQMKMNTPTAEKGGERNTERERAGERGKYSLNTIWKAHKLIFCQRKRKLKKNVYKISK